MKSKGNKFTALLIYINDIIIIGNSRIDVDELKNKINNEFKIKNLENLKYFLGIEVVKSKQEIHIYKRKYALNLLKDTGILEGRTSSFPLDQNTKLSKN